MKPIIILILSCILTHKVSSQTVDFTIMLLLKFRTAKNVCGDLSCYKDLTITTKGSIADFCTFKCELKNLKAKADSTILSSGIRLVNLQDGSFAMDLRQYYHNSDSALAEYSTYVSALIQEFENFPGFYKYKIKKTSDNQYRYIELNVQSTYLYSKMKIGLKQNKGKYCIYTEIFNVGYTDETILED